LLEHFGKALAWLYSRAEVLEQTDDEEFMHLKIAIEPADADRFTAQFPYKFNKTKTRKKKSKAS